MIPQLLNICTGLQDHDQRNLRIDRRQLEQRSRLRKIVSGRIGQVIRHARWHVVMEVKAEPEFAKIFQEGRAHKYHIKCNSYSKFQSWTREKAYIMWPPM